ncbi:hypothetical protein HDV05_004621 [Chytridiales sp. JEL 0842]|nr:hypothetical protein HDV05_004621 [Chytridiales sp. JEL 0842]
MTSTASTPPHTFAIASPTSDSSVGNPPASSTSTACNNDQPPSPNLTSALLPTSSTSLSILNHLSGLANPRLCILDSSFNPPTLAHLHLLLQSSRNANENLPAFDTYILLHATSNADKPPTQDLHHRLSMMSLTAQSFNRLHASQHKKVYVALTTAPLFIQKSSTIHHHLPNAEQHWILGFDTIIRLLDPKYYPESSTVWDALKLMWEVYKCHFIVFPRASDNSSDLSASQKVELEKMLADRGFPRWVWTEFFHFVSPPQGLEDVFALSSTRAREAVSGTSSMSLAEKGRVLEELMIPEVVNYIIQHGIYL